uniref:Uncharacterized protein n=1 Tax=Hucho hucho TaxID=62062 RepID=A0A4W5PS09_9TELE
MLRQICPEMDTAESGVFRSSRLPDLCMVIVTDSRQTGTVHVEDVMQAGSRQHHQELQDLQTKLSFDDPINIQFTSVSILLKKKNTLQLISWTQISQVLY